MHLTQRSGRARLCLDRLEQRVELPLIELLQVCLQRAERQRRHLILQARQRGADRPGQHVLPLRSLLAELEDRPLHLPERIAQQRADRFPVDPRPPGRDALHEQAAGDPRPGAAQLQEAPERRRRGA